MGTIGEYLHRSLGYPEHVTAAIPGVNRYGNRNETDFDTIVSALEDAGATCTDEKLSCGGDYGRADVVTDDVFDRDYSADEGTTLLYVPDGSRWNDPESMKFHPLDGYKRVIEQMDVAGLDAALFAHVDDDLDRYETFDGDYASRLALSHPDKTFVPIDWTPGNQGDGDTLLLVTGANDKTLESPGTQHSYDAEPGRVTGAD